jgi:hypothetical protein
MMGKRVFGFGLVALLLALFLGGSARAQNAQGAQGAVATWQRLSDPAFDASKFAAVEGIELVRDAMHIKLTDGVIQFAEPAEGKEFGAVFSGRGRLQIAPPNAIELAQLKLLAKQEPLDLEFTEAIFCFADATFGEISSQIRWGPVTKSDLGKLYHDRQNFREKNELEMLPRLFQAVLSTNPQTGNYFAAELKTKGHGWILVCFDPNELEQVAVGRWSPSSRLETWMRFPAGKKSVIADHLAASFKLPFSADTYQIDARVGAKGELEATTIVHVKIQKDGERVLLFGLDAFLRVESIADSTGANLPFFQSRAPSITSSFHYGDYVAVVMPSAEKSGTEDELKFRYAGKHAIQTSVEDNGVETYGATGGWYPGVWSPYDPFGRRSRFQMTFHSPKKMTFLASARKISESQEADTLVTTWESDAPQTAAGFSYGDFNHDEDTFDSTKVDVYVNPAEPRSPGPQHVDSKQARALLLEGSENLLHVFDPYFGNYPYKRIGIVDHGDATGAGLLSVRSEDFLDLPSFAASRGGGPGRDSGEGQAPPIPSMGRLRLDASLGRTIRAGKPFAQQWWGVLVSPTTYHDQWLFAGLSEFSGLLYASALRGKSSYLNGLDYYRAYLERSAEGVSGTYESVGPVWLGGRLISSRVPGGGFIIQYKAAWIIHMLRMMFWDPSNEDPDKVFKAVLQDFATSFANRAASTEDFKAIVEKHMTPEMDMEHGRNMDWFFRQYVYGTGIPQYKFSYEKLGEEGGQWRFKCKITRTGVPAGWKDLLVLDQHENGKDYRVQVIQMNAPEVVFNLTSNTKPGNLHLVNFDVLADFKQ